MTMVENWSSIAACGSGDPDALFVPGAAQNVAKRICKSCPVRLECLADALDNRIEFGVWGGMTERERRALLRRKPDVSSWRQLFRAAMESGDRASPQSCGVGPEIDGVTRASTVEAKPVTPIKHARAGSSAKASPAQPAEKVGEFTTNPREAASAAA